MKVCTLYIQETISKKLYTIYKKTKPYLKCSLHSFIMVLIIYTGKRQISYGRKNKLD